MGVLDKIKNALFEVEYVEVDEPPKKEKKQKEKKKEKVKDDDKPIAKKIVLPGKREEKVEEIHEEELVDEDFEIKPKHVKTEELSREQFKFMDDEDFKMDVDEEPEIVHVIEDSDSAFNKEEDIVSVSVPTDNLVAKKEEFVEDKNVYSNTSYNNSNNENNNHGNKLYGLDSSYSIPVHQYGTYEKKEEKSVFRPSPIISPIYGILDKNYKKEDVVSKSEVRITTNYTRTNVSVDDIRNKAYGGEERKRRGDREVEKVEEKIEETTFEVDDGENDNILVDLSDKNKPEVKEITMGDALEYFQDLGLEYNVDYVDASKDNSIAKRSEKVSVDTNNENVSVSNVVEHRNEGVDSNIDKLDDDSDNLFDLIDSMYQDN